MMVDEIETTTRECGCVTKRNARTGVASHTRCLSHALAEMTRIQKEAGQQIRSELSRLVDSVQALDEQLRISLDKERYDARPSLRLRLKWAWNHLCRRVFA